MPFRKEEILAQIRRLAAANGGIAPGRLALESETGIRFSDWSGVHWARYSDAVREAGCEPNKLTTAYKTEDILKILATATRELGHIPTYPELALKTRSQKGFPAGKTFGRLGNKTEQTEKLLAYCKERSDLEDVASICEAALAILAKNEETDETRDSIETSGFVYLFRSGRRYKFGFTNDTDRRIRELAHQTAEPINKVHAIQTDDPSGIEAYWKRRFAAKCVHNEWFNLDAKDVAAFRRRKKFM